MKVDPAFLVAMLHLPQGTEILDARFERTNLVFVVSHPDIPKGKNVEVEPQFRKVVDVTTHHDSLDIEFLGWNPSETA